VTTEVVVQRGKRTRVELLLPPPTSVAREIAFFGGLGLAVGGAALLGLAVARAGDPAHGACFLRGGASPLSCPSSIALTFGYGASDRLPSSDASDLAPPGIAIGTAGAGLLGLGAILSAGAVGMARRDEAVPWLWLLIGAGAAGLAFGIAAALSPR
jgi:hypothetical protein